MSAADPVRSGPSTGFDDPPAFDLEYLFDDPLDPTEVTVFLDDGEADLTTHWITVDAEHAVPLEDVA